MACEGPTLAESLTFFAARYSEAVAIERSLLRALTRVSGFDGGAFLPARGPGLRRRRGPLVRRRREHPARRWRGRAVPLGGHLSVPFRRWSIQPYGVVGRVPEHSDGAHAGRYLHRRHDGVPAHSGHLIPNPPKDTDGRREDSGRVGEGATGEMAGLHWGRLEVGGRSSVAAQAP